jgi:ABC-2 type transport system permease protein
VSAVIAGTGSRDDLVPPGHELRSGFPYWMDSLRSMLRYDWGGMRPWVGMMVVIQTMMGAGMVLMYGFFYPQITARTALYIATGAPTLALIPLGFVLVPNAVMMDKLRGTFDYVWSMPVPRSAHATSTFALFTGLALPGMVLALLAATWRYGIHLSLSPVLIPAVLLCALMSVTVGYALALAISNPLVTNVIVNALIFVVLLFSPIVYPASQLPGWLFDVHQVLPFESMATVIRAGLTTGLATDVGLSFLVLGAWAVAGCAVTAWVVGRRA